VSVHLRIAVDGKERDVRVDGEPPDIRVTVEGRTTPVRVALDGTAARVDIEGRTLILQFGGGVRVDGILRSVAVEWVADESGAVGASAVIDIRPPMPGRIVRVLAKPGDAIRKGAPLLILEAMKMQNEIPAPIAGTVREVRVKEGDAVTAGDVVVRMGRDAGGKG
jgi:biotin carboxyl carrier protein